MNPRVWKLSALLGFLVGLSVAGVMSFIAWQHNPQGIFHDELGTNWDFVFDTALSWFVPVAPIMFALSVVVLSWIYRR